MNDTTPPGQPSPGASHPEPPRSGQERFFAWLRSLGIVRGNDRWFAGVAGGVAARAGIDPLIVRGIFVVLAIVSGAGVLLYLAGWLLLPDQSGRIHVEELLRGRASAGVIVAAVVLGVVVVIPVVIGLFSAVLGGPWNWGLWHAWGFGLPGWVGVILSVLWWILIAGLIVWAIVWFASGRHSGSGSAPRPGSTPGAGPGAEEGAPSAAPRESTPDVAETAARGAEPGDHPVGPSAAPFAGRQAGEQQNPQAPQAGGFAEQTRAFADRTEEAAGRIGEQASGWGAQLGDWSRQTREEARQWSELGREHHRSHRLGAAHVVITLALALLAAGAAALWAFSVAANGDLVVTAGLIAAVVVLALSMIVAGVRGRESGWIGFLSFVGVLALIFAPFSNVMPDQTRFVPFGNYGSVAVDDDPDNGLVMIGGNSTLDLTGLTASAAPRDIEVWVLGGNVNVLLPDTVPTIAKADVFAGNVREVRGADGQSQSGLFVSRTVASGTRGADESGIIRVHVRLFAGNVRVVGGLGPDGAPAGGDTAARKIQDRLAEAEQKLSEQQARLEEEQRLVDELQSELEGAR